MNNSAFTGIKVLFRADNNPALLSIRPDNGGESLPSILRQLPANDHASAYEVLAEEIKKLMGFEIRSENWRSAFAKLRTDGAEVLFTRDHLYAHSKECHEKLSAARYGYDLAAHYFQPAKTLLVTDRLHGGKESNLPCDSLAAAYKRLADLIEKRFNLVVHPERYEQAFGNLQGRKFSVAGLRDFTKPPQEMGI